MDVNVIEDLIREVEEYFFYLKITNLIDEKRKIYNKYRNIYTEHNTKIKNISWSNKKIKMNLKDFQYQHSEFCNYYKSKPLQNNEIFKSRKDILKNYSREIRFIYKIHIGIKPYTTQFGGKNTIVCKKIPATVEQLERGYPLIGLYKEDNLAEKPKVSSYLWDVHSTELELMEDLFETLFVDSMDSEDTVINIMAEIFILTNSYKSRSKSNDIANIYKSLQIRKNDKSKLEEKIKTYETIIKDLLNLIGANYIHHYETRTLEIELKKLYSNLDKSFIIVSYVLIFSSSLDLSFFRICNDL